MRKNELHLKTWQVWLILSGLAAGLGLTGGKALRSVVDNSGRDDDDRNNASGQIKGDLRTNLNEDLIITIEPPYAGRGGNIALWNEVDAERERKELERQDARNAVIEKVLAPQVRFENARRSAIIHVRDLARELRRDADFVRTLTPAERDQLESLAGDTVFIEKLIFDTDFAGRRYERPVVSKKLSDRIFARDAAHVREEVRRKAAEPAMSDEESVAKIVADIEAETKYYADAFRAKYLTERFVSDYEAVEELTSRRNEAAELSEIARVFLGNAGFARALDADERMLLERIGQSVNFAEVFLFGHGMRITNANQEDIRTMLSNADAANQLHNKIRNKIIARGGR